MNYANPTATEYNIKKESVLAVIGALPQKYNIQAKVNALITEIKAKAEKVIYGVEGKPDPDSYKIYFEGVNSPPFIRNGTGYLTGINPIFTDFSLKYGHAAILNRNHHYFTKAANNINKKDWWWLVSNRSLKPKPTKLEPLTGWSQSNYAMDTETPRIQYSNKSLEGTNIFVNNTVDFYFKAYAGTPRQFWEFISKHRIVSEYSSNYSGMLLAKIVPVNPNTGAPKNSGIIVAAAPIGHYISGTGDELQDHSYRFLSEVQQTMFPDVPISEPGKNPKILTDTTNYYANELGEAQQIWKSTPMKAASPIVAVVQHNWNMMIEDTGRSYFDSRDGKHPEAYGPISKMARKPMHIMQVGYYIQSPDTEAAVSRILISTPKNPSAIETWFQREEIFNQRGSTRYNNLIQAVYSVLQHPWIYMEGNGLNKLLDYKARNALGGTQRDISETKLLMEEVFGTEYIKNNNSFNRLNSYQWSNRRKAVDLLISDVRKVFEIARWPTMPAKKLFSAPVNDEQDLLFIRTKLNQALEGPDYPKPREMYLPEALNRQLKSTSSQSAPYWELTSGIDNQFTRNSNRYMFNSDKVYYHSLYSANGVTIRTRKRVGKIQSMVDLVSKRQVARTEMGSLNDIDTAGTIGIVGGALAVVAAAYAINRNRSR